MNVTNVSRGLLLAQVKGVGGESYLQAFCRAVGPSDCVVVLLAGLAVFAGACFLVAKCRQPSVIASCLIFLPLPLLIALFRALGKQVEGLLTLSASSVQPSTAQIAAAVASGLAPLFLALMVTWPSYLVFAVGLVVRTVNHSKGR